MLFPNLSVSDPAKRWTKDGRGDHHGWRGTRRGWTCLVHKRFFGAEQDMKYSEQLAISDHI